MTREEIDKILTDLNKTKDRNIVIVDYGNVQKWEAKSKTRLVADFDQNQVSPKLTLIY